MSRHIAHYTLVRLLPQSDAGEFANIGVLVACPATGFFDFKLITRYARITRFFEEFTRELLIQVRRDVQAELAHLRDHLRMQQQATGLREDALILRLIGDLVQPRETMIRYAPSRVALTPDPQQLLEQVFVRYVQRTEQESERRRRSVLDQQVCQLLQQDAPLYRQFRQDRDISAGDFHVEFPLILFDGERPRAAIKALDLAQRDPQKIYDHGGFWAERLRRLERKNAMPDGVLITVKTPGSVEERGYHACQEILTELTEMHSVQIADILQPDRILAFAREHVH